ncbi:MAG: hypothetical protein JNK05_28495 [Myxococcales bacterium]|nr:hypothetical protein [Myxococcales bacterium]
MNHRVDSNGKLPRTMTTSSKSHLVDPLEVEHEVFEVDDQVSTKVSATALGFTQPRTDRAGHVAQQREHHSKSPEVRERTQRARDFIFAGKRRVIGALTQQFVSRARPRLRELLAVVRERLMERSAHSFFSFTRRGQFVERGVGRIEHGFESDVDVRGDRLKKRFERVVVNQLSREEVTRAVHECDRTRQICLRQICRAISSIITFNFSL